MSMDRMDQTPQPACHDSKSTPFPSGPAHGGALAQARRLFPNAPEPLLDLSTGINPVPYPIAKTPSLRTAPATKQPRAANAPYTRLPEPDDEANLRAAAATAYGVSDPHMIAAAPGTQILISLLPLLLARPPGRVAILSPTYAEHAESWRNAGHTIQETACFEALADADIAILCNPNNPDGHRTPSAKIRALADRLERRGGLLIVDESFADLEPPGISAATHLPHSALIILRSFGKSYGLAGLRLGFALAAPDTAALIRRALGPWAISGVALPIATTALADPAWREATTRRLQTDIVHLDALAKSLNLTLIGGTRLFRLYDHPNAIAIHNQLGQAGILVRRFDTHPTRLRFGLPGTPQEWTRLEAALAQVHTPSIPPAP